MKANPSRQAPVPVPRPAESFWSTPQSAMRRAMTFARDAMTGKPHNTPNLYNGNPSLSNECPSVFQADYNPYYESGEYEAKRILRRYHPDQYYQRNCCWDPEETCDNVFNYDQQIIEAEIAVRSINEPVDVSSRYGRLNFYIRDYLDVDPLKCTKAFCNAFHEPYTAPGRRAQLFNHIRNYCNLFPEDNPSHVWVVHYFVLSEKGGLLDIINQRGLLNAMANLKFLPGCVNYICVRPKNVITPTNQLGLEKPILSNNTGIVWLARIGGSLAMIKMFKDDCPDEATAELLVGVVYNNRYHDSSLYDNTVACEEGWFTAQELHVYEVTDPERPALGHEEVNSVRDPVKVLSHSDVEMMCSAPLKIKPFVLYSPRIKARSIVELANEIFIKRSRHIPLTVVALLAWKMIRIVRQLHKLHLIHGSIRLETFAVGHNQHCRAISIEQKVFPLRVYGIDFSTVIDAATDQNLWHKSAKLYTGKVHSGDYQCRASRCGEEWNFDADACALAVSIQTLINLKPASVTELLDGTLRFKAAQKGLKSTVSRTLDEMLNAKHDTVHEILSRAEQEFFSLIPSDKAAMEAYRDVVEFCLGVL